MVFRLGEKLKGAVNSIGEKFSAVKDSVSNFGVKHSGKIAIAGAVGAGIYALGEEKRGYIQEEKDKTEAGVRAKNIMEGLDRTDYRPPVPTPYKPPISIPQVSLGSSIDKYKEQQQKDSVAKSSTAYKQNRIQREKDRNAIPGVSKINMGIDTRVGDNILFQKKLAEERLAKKKKRRFRRGLF